MLTLLFAFIAPAVSAWICTAAGYTGYAWAGMFILLGTAAFAGLVLVYIVFLSICSLFVNPKKPRTSVSPFYHFLLIQTAGLLLCLCGVRVKAGGLEKLPTGRPFLLVGNHRSNFDPIVAIWALRKYKISFVSKPENLRIPVVGRIIHQCAFLPIDREDDRRAVVTILAAAEQIRSGACSVGIYPEGTRNREHTGLLPFKNGSFKIAQRTGAPVVVAAIDGSERIHRRAPLPVHVQFSIAGVIEQPEGARCGTQDLSRQARQMLCRALQVEDPGE